MYKKKKRTRSLDTFECNLDSTRTTINFHIITTCLLTSPETQMSMIEALRAKYQIPQNTFKIRNNITHTTC